MSYARWFGRLLVLALAVLVLARAGDPEIVREQRSAPSAASGIGNPAAAYCTAIMGYSYEIVTEPDGSSWGACLLPDGERCDQWEFYAGTCGEAQSYCARQGYTTQTRTDGQDPYVAEYAVCLGSDGHMVGSVWQLSGLGAMVRGNGSAPQPGPPGGDALPLPETAMATLALPPAIDWRDYNGANWLTGVKNQGNCGSCWAFAAVAISEAHHNIVANNPALDLNLAEQQLVSCSGAGSCEGGYSSRAMTYMQESGIVDEACMPYTAAESACTTCSDASSRLTYIDEATCFVPTRDTLRQHIVENGPVYVYMGIGEDYGGSFSNGVYHCAIDSETGDLSINHAVVAVGYDDAAGTWIVRNSWGSTWDGDGYFLVGYGECNLERTFAGYAYVIAPSTAANVRPDGWVGPYTNDTTPRFRWDAATDSGSGIAGYYVAVDDWTPDGTLPLDWWVGNVLSYSVPAALAEGLHRFAVTSVDRFGNLAPTNTDQEGDAPYTTFYVDTQAPVSAVRPLVAEQTAPTFTVSWSGTDALSGIASYDIQFRLGECETWITWLSGTTATSADFRAPVGGTYSFRSVARDRAGNVEAELLGDGDASTIYVAPVHRTYLPLMQTN